MTTFEEKLKEAMQEHLPAQMFEYAKEQMKKVEEYQSTIKTLKNTNAIMEDKLENFKNELDKHGDLDKKVENYNAEVEVVNGMKADLEQRERDMKIRLSEKDRICANDKALFAMNTVDKLLRNTTFRTKTIEDVVATPHVACSGEQYNMAQGHTEKVPDVEKTVEKTEE